MFILCKRIKCPYWESGCKKYGDDITNCHMTVFDGIFPYDKGLCFETATLVDEKSYQDFNKFYLKVESIFSTKVPLKSLSNQV